MWYGKLGGANHTFPLAAADLGEDGVAFLNGGSRLIFDLA